MGTTVQHKRSETTGAEPASGDILVGEIAVNLTDGKLFSKKSDGTVVTLAGNLTATTYYIPTSLGYITEAADFGTDFGLVTQTVSNGNTQDTNTDDDVTFNSVTTTAGVTVGGLATFNYTGAGSTSTVTIGGYNSKGGTGYNDFLKVSNGYVSATNPNKWFRLTSVGTLEIVNSAYTSVLASLDESGNMEIFGSVKMPNRPAFRVIGNGGQISATTTVTSSHWVLDYQQGSALNTSTGIFTAPIAGLYQVNLVMRTAANNNSGINQAYVLKTSGGSSTVACMLEFGTNTSMNHAGVGTVIKLAVGDTLKAVVTAGTLSFDSNDNFSVAYIG